MTVSETNRWRSVFLACLLALMGCGQDQRHRTEVAVAAAADLRFALDELLVAFHQQYPSIHVEVVYGSSGNFYAQLVNKAPFDLYLSADINYPNKLVQGGFAFEQSRFNYAVGQLVVWVPNGSKLDLDQKGMQALLDPSVQKLAIASPAHAPYGRAAEAALKTYGIYDSLKDRLVLGDNIVQTAQFVESGAADAGIIALSLALAPTMQGKGRFWVVPEDAHPPLLQGGVILRWAKDREAVEKLRTFLTGPAGQAVLKKYGFGIPGA